MKLGIKPLTKCAQVLCLATLCVWLSGCMYQTDAADAIAARPSAQYALTQQKRLVALGHGEVQVIHLGDTYRFILPQKYFFIRYSPRLISSKYAVLDLLAAYIKPIAKSNVTVSGYTDSSCSKERNTSLSRARAKLVANYLWDRGINARLVSVKAHGRCNKLVKHRTESASQNRRVEIRFTKVTQVPLI